MTSHERWALWDKWAGLYERGASIPAISQISGMSTNRIWYGLRKMGVRMRGTGYRSAKAIGNGRTDDLSTSRIDRMLEIVSRRKDRAA